MQDMDDVMERLRNALKETGLTDDQIDALSEEDEEEGAIYLYRTPEPPSSPTLH
jgi:hypothetical protein